MICANDFGRKFELRLGEICSHSPSGARIMSYFNAYHGIKYDFLDFWIQKSDSGTAPCALCRYYSTLMICGEPCDKAELEDFVCMLSPSVILCDAEYDFSDSYERTCGEIMTCKKLIAPSEPYQSIHRSLSDMAYLKKIYSLLCRTDDRIAPNCFEDYFLDLSHKIRHASAEVYSIYEGSEPISTAAVTSLSGSAAVIGCVATDHEYRNKGLASSLVYYITDRHMKKGREVFLQREKKIGLYEKLGFEVCGTWYEYKKIADGSIL